MQSISDSESQLRRYIRGVLVEKAFTVKDAKQNDLALLVIDKSAIRHIILYDASKLLSFFSSKIKRIQKIENEISRYDIVDYDEMQRFLYAYLGTSSANRAGRAYNAQEVVGSAAKSGWGPLAYDIALSLHKNGLMPDRNSVSPAAANVWAFYDQNRKDVKKLQLDDITDPKTKPKIDDAETHNEPERPQLDKVYVKNSGVNITTLKKAHEDFLNNAVDLFKSYGIRYTRGQCVEDLSDTATTYFSDML